MGSIHLILRMSWISSIQYLFLLSPPEAITEQASSPWEPATPHTTKQLDKQMRVLHARIQNGDQSPTKSLLSQVEKACRNDRKTPSQSGPQIIVFRVVKSRPHSKSASAFAPCCPNNRTLPIKAAG